MKVMIDIPKEAFELIKSDAPIDFLDAVHIINTIQNGIPLPENHGRKFEEIVVQYQPAELCIYPEYKGKPYFSIKYENGKHIIGYGTYNPEVLSGYLRDYFITPTIEADKENNE